MEFSPNITTARLNLHRLVSTPDFANLPKYVKDAYFEATAEPSPVAALVKGMEALWAGKEALGKGGKTILADIAYHVVQGGFSAQSGKPERASAMLIAMRRDLGEIKGGDPKDDPSVEDRFLSAEAASDAASAFNGADPAAFDHDGDGKAGGSLPKGPQKATGASRSG